MTQVVAVQVGLALLVLGVGVYTVAARGTFAAVAGFVVYGLLLSLTWVSLRAVDVALTEAAIGGGLTGVLLISAAIRLRGAGYRMRAESPAPATRILVAALCALVTAGLAAAILALPEASPSLADEAAAALPATGLGNPVTAVLLAYRAIDTLLESVVLVFALIGVWSLAPDAAWGGRPEVAAPPDPHGPLAFGTRLLAPPGIVVGLYIFWIGADHPGGKFQAGTILAAMAMLVLMAGLARPPRIDARWLRVAAVAGPLVFLAVGLAGIATAGAFLAYPEAWAKTLIIVIEAALLPTVAAILALLLAGAPMRPVPN